MDATVLGQLKDLGIAGAVALAAIGSGLGAGYAGMAAIGAWKKCYMQNKAAPFLLLAFVGAPLTQTIYGFLLLLTLRGLVDKGVYAWGFGLLGGAALGWIISAVINVFASSYLASQASSNGYMSSAPIATSTPFWLPVFSIVFATLVGLLSGLYPSLNAATLVPVDALKYE